MRASRLLSILLLLQARGRLKAGELARELEVSLRTVYRDVDELSAAGVPVYGERGPDGGFELLDGYQTRLTGLTGEESRSLGFAGLGDALAGLGVDEALATARLKLLAALPAEHSQTARTIASRFHFDPTPWYVPAEPAPFLRRIAEAVWGGRRLEILYRSWKSTGVRVIDPLGLVLKNGCWYLVASSAEKPRTYRIASIIEVRAVGPCAAAADFDLAAYWRSSVADFKRRLYGSRARVLITPAGLSQLSYNGYPLDGVKERGAASAGDSFWHDVELPIESLEQAANLLLGLGGEVEVLEPAELRMRMVKETERLLGLYGADRLSLEAAPDHLDGGTAQREDDVGVA